MDFAINIARHGQQGGVGRDCGVTDFFTFRKLYQKVKQHGFGFEKIVDFASPKNHILSQKLQNAFNFQTTSCKILFVLQPLSP